MGLTIPQREDDCTCTSLNVYSLRHIPLTPHLKATVDMLATGLILKNTGLQLNLLAVHPPWGVGRNLQKRLGLQ